MKRCICCEGGFGELEMVESVAGPVCWECYMELESQGKKIMPYEEDEQDKDFIELLIFGRPRKSVCG